MSIIRLEWEDAVAALLNMLCKDRIHDYGKYSGGFKKISSFIQDSGLAGGSNILDEALKIQVLDALYNQILLNNEGGENMYCIKESNIDIDINGIYGINIDGMSYKVYICKPETFPDILSEYKHYIKSDENVDEINDEEIKTICIDFWLDNKLCIDISNIKFFIKNLCIEENISVKQYKYILNQIKPNFSNIIECIRKSLYAILDTLNYDNKIRLFACFNLLYDTILAGQNIQNIEIRNQGEKNYVLIYIEIVQLLFLQYMSYYICKEICRLYALQQIPNCINTFQPHEMPDVIQRLMAFRQSLELYINIYGRYSNLLKKIILNIFNNNGIFGPQDIIVILMQIKSHIRFIINKRFNSLFDIEQIRKLKEQICLDHNINVALKNIIEEKQILVSLSFFFYDMLDDDENENYQLIKNTELTYGGVKIHKIGDIGFLLRMIKLNIENLKEEEELGGGSLKKGGSIEIDDVTINYLNELRDILIQILKKRYGRIREGSSYDYYMQFVESRDERIDYTFEEICVIVKENIINKIKLNIIELQNGVKVVPNVVQIGQIFTTDSVRLPKRIRNEEVEVEVGGGKKLSKKNISYDDIYYIIQSNLGLYNTSNNYYGGGVGEDNWYEMFKQFTVMALGMKELRERSPGVGALVGINHIDDNYNKYIPLTRSDAYGFNDITESNPLFSDWFNFEKASISGKNNKVHKDIEDHESTYMRRLFISNNFSIPDVNAPPGGLAPLKYPIIDDVMSLEKRYEDLNEGRPLFTKAVDWYDWFSSPPLNISNINELQELKLTVTNENSYGNVKFPIYDEQLFNNDLFPLISKNIKQLALTPPGGDDEYKMKYIVNNEASKLSKQIKYNILNNYATYSDPGNSGSNITELDEYGEKYIMGFYGVTRILNKLGTLKEYLPGTDLTPHLIGPNNGQVTELITDGYITILKPRIKEHAINIYSTQHNTYFNLQTPNNHMATYECKRLCTDFGVDKWQGVSLQVALIKSLDVLKKYMDSFVGKTYTDRAGNINKFINTASGNWKEWNFMFNDYGVIRSDDGSNTMLILNNRINTKYKSIPDINDFVIGTHIPGDVSAIHVWNNDITQGGLNYTNGASVDKCWLRLPCFSIFNQISIFKGNGDICQELYTLTKFGGIYQNNIVHNPGAHAGGYNPENLDNDTLGYLQSCKVYPPANYSKPASFPFGLAPGSPVAPNNYYGAGAYKIINTTDNFGRNLLSIHNNKYIPYDRFGNAPRAFVSGDRLSGLRYIMLSFLGLKYYIRRICNNTILNTGTVLNVNQELCNNINILSFGGYNYRLLNSIMSKINFNFINKIYANKIGPPRNDQIYDILRSLYQTKPGGPAALTALQPFNQFHMLTNYEGINTAGGGKKSKTLKKKLGNKNIKKRTKKISKKNKKTIKKIKNIKKNPKKSQKIRKTYKNKK